MKAINYLKNNGLKRAVTVLWTYKIELFLEKIMLFFFRKKSLKDIIVIESHNDFDCNGGAFYNYLLQNGYNKKYLIVWLVRRRFRGKLPNNVKAVPLYGPSIRKAYYMCNYKFMLFDSEGGRKLRKDQKLVYCSHGAGGLKSTKGKIVLSDDIDYILMQSKKYAPIQAGQWLLSPNDRRIVCIGYPSHDIFFEKSNLGELKKITEVKFKKIVLWMPTFRKSIEHNRNDSTKEQKFGIPLFSSSDDFARVNSELEKKNTLLIVKIHPKQDLNNLAIPDVSNIIVLTGDDVKRLRLDNYKLMCEVDALITDYSGAAFEFLQLNKPIGYVLDDMKEYKRGFVVEDIHKLIAGEEIYSVDDLMKFIDDVSNGYDRYEKKRKELRNYIYEYHDNKSSERLVKLLNL